MARRALVAVCVLGLFLALPFLAKPVHLDDWVFITGAKQFCAHPGAALDGRVGFFGRDVSFAAGTHPPLLFLYLALARFLTGGFNEVALHIFYLLFVLPAALGAFALARRFNPPALGDPESLVYTTLLVLAAPAVMVTSHSLMADFPTLALFLAGLAAYVYALDGKGRGYFVTASLCIAGAVFASYQALFILPLLMLYTFLQKKSLKLFFITAILPLGLLGVWFLYAARAVGGPHLISAFAWGGLKYPAFFTKTADTLVGFLCVIGSVTVFPLSLLWALRPAAGKRAVYFLGIGTLAYLNITRISDYTLWQRMFFAIFFLGGWLAVVEAGRLFLTAVKDRTAGAPWPVRADAIFLSAWFLGFLAAATLLLPQGISRYFIFAVFPLTAVALRRCPAKSFLVPAAVLTVGLGFLTSWADYGLATADRTAALKISRSFPGTRFYFTGELGWRYYMEELGHQYLLDTTECLLPGSRVVTTESYLKSTMAPLLRLNLKETARLRFAVNWPLTVMSRPARADFYSSANGWGFLPYAPSPRGTVAAFTVYDYADEGVLRPVPPAAVQALLPVEGVKGPLVLAQGRLSATRLKQGEGLAVDLTWFKPVEGRTPLCTWMFLKSRYAQLLFSHGPFVAPAPAGVALAETYRIYNVGRDVFPGDYEVYAGVMPVSAVAVKAEEFDLAKYPGSRKLGTVTVAPCLYPAQAESSEPRGYLPQFRRRLGPGVTFALTAGNTMTVPVSGAVTAKGLEVISFLAYGARVEQGRPVAEVTAFCQYGTPQHFILRAGADTADWGVEDPARPQGFYRHAKARVYGRWPVYGKQGFFWGYRYVTKFQFTKSLQPFKIDIRYVDPEGILIVDDLNLLK